MRPAWMVVSRDIGTWPISRDIATLFPANVVRGLVPRTHLDYNRPAALAFEQQQFAASYSAYHGMVFQHLWQMARAVGPENLLVLDVHSFPNEPYGISRANEFDLILGTKYRATVPHGEPDRAFAAFMQARGYAVHLPDEESAHGNGRQRELFDGGFTVRDIASRHHVNALQIEIRAAKFCTRNSAVAGTRLSADIAAFLAANYWR